jgi:O-antigen/teichoic acid export membrane protein
VAFNGERHLLAVGAGSLVVSVALSFALIPSWGDEGAAWSYVGGLYAGALLSLVVLRPHFRRPARDAEA